MDDLIKIKGMVRMELIGADGQVKQITERENLVTTVGKNLIAGLIAAEVVTAPNYLGIGTSNTAASVGQTALIGTELARVAVTGIRTTNSVAYTATFNAGTGTGTIEEAGLFNASSVGTMAARWLTGTVVKGASDSLVITWTLTVS